MNAPHRTDGLSRRHFLRGLTGAAGAFLLAGCARDTADAPVPDPAPADAALPAVASPSNIGVQLYTVRDRMQEDFEGTIEQVAEIGYKELEFAGYYGRTPEQVRALLDRLDLRAPSAHIGLELLREDLAGQIASAQTIGHTYITIPALPRVFDDGAEGVAPEQWVQYAAEFNRMGEACRDAGLRLAYHNHAFEFVPAGGGRTGMDVLIQETDPELVDFELDLMWTVVAAHDPVALIEQYPGRFVMWHVKDLKGAAEVQAANREGRDWERGAHIAAAGEGEIDFGSIFLHAETSGLEHFFVENDAPADSLANIRRSHDHLSELLG